MKTYLALILLLCSEAFAQRFIEKSWFNNPEDAAPLTDPYIASPDTHSWDAVEISGSMAISGGALVFTNGTTQNNLGIRRTLSRSREFGVTMLGEVKVTDAVK